MITYSLLIFSVGFLAYLLIQVHLHIYAHSGRNAPLPDTAPTPSASLQKKKGWASFSWRTLFDGGAAAAKRAGRPRATDGYAVVAPDTTTAEDEVELDDATDAYWSDPPARSVGARV
jgi:hypothetical protein